MKDKFKLFFLLTFIILIGAIARLYRLDKIPVGLHIDEAQVGYNAYSLLETGKDENGEFLPTHLTLWKVDRPLGIAYLTIPGIIFFGLNEYGTRFPTAVFGILTILSVYFLTKEIFGNKSISLLSSFLLALSPWHIILSRATSEAIISLFFYLTGIYFCLKAIRIKSYLSVIFSYVVFTISFFMYHSSRIIVPLLIGYFAFRAYKEAKIKITGAFLITLIVYLLFPLLIFSSTSKERFELVSIFYHPETKLVMEEQIREDGNKNPIILTRLAHNKLINYGIKLSNNFLSYFDYEYLLYQGGLPLRYRIPDTGLIYFVEFPFLIIGIVALAVNFILRKKTELGLIILLILLGLLPAAITFEESPNINRSILVFPVFQWLIAFGLFLLWNKMRKKFNKAIIFMILGLFFLWNIYYFYHQYTVHSFVHKPWYRNYEMKETAIYLSQKTNKYKAVYLTFNSTEPYIYFLYYNQLDPVLWQKNIKKKGLEENWNNFKKIKIVRSDCPDISKNQRKSDILVVYKINCLIPRGARIVRKFRYSDKETALIAVDFPKGYSYMDPSIKYEPLKKVNF